MQSSAKTPDEYTRELPEDRKEPIKKLCEVTRKHIPKGFKEVMQNGMISHVVPRSPSQLLELSDKEIWQEQWEKTKKLANDIWIEAEKLIDKKRIVQGDLKELDYLSWVC